MTDSIDLDRLDDDAHWEVLARFVAGECLPDEVARVERWLAAAPERAQVVAALRASLGSVDALASYEAPAGLDTEAALAKVRARRRTAGVTSINARRRRWMPLAAAAALLLVAGVTWMRSAPAASPERTVATAVGERDSLDLPDGSRVILGPSSRLVVAAGFAEGRRQVSVEGEAYFIVRHDAAHPFEVRAGDARIVDVGTEFMVRRDAVRGVEVAVVDGIVDLRTAAATAAVRLDAGDRAQVPVGGVAAVRRDDVTPDDAALRRGTLVFRETSFDGVAADLLRWYGVTLVASTAELAGRHVTASFTREDRAAAVEVIALALGAAVEWRGDTAILRPQLLRPAR